MAREGAGSSGSVDSELKDIGHLLFTLLGLLHGLARSTATFEDYSLDLFRLGQISSIASVGFSGTFV